MLFDIWFVKQRNASQAPPRPHPINYMRRVLAFPSDR
jgi:hypothetical protein